MPTTEPAWDIAKLFPDQGYWSEEDYLYLPGQRLIEFVDGKIEVLEMPSERHQRIIGFLYSLLLMYIQGVVAKIATNTTGVFLAVDERTREDPVPCS